MLAERDSERLYKMSESREQIKAHNVPQEKWDAIFPGKKAFEERYGRILRYNLKGKTETYEYYDNKDEQVKTISFQRPF